MAKSYLKVVRVMGWCNLNNTCTKFHINVLILYYWNGLVNYWKP